MSIPLEFTGDLSIRAIGAAHGVLTEAMKGGGDIMVSVADEATIDLTFVQLIEAGRRTARGAGQAFSLSASASGPLLETLRRGGFLEAAGDRDFWLMQSGI